MNQAPISTDRSLTPPELPIHEDAIVSTCTSSEVEIRTRNGWYVRAICEEETFVTPPGRFVQEVLPGHSYTTSVLKQDPAERQKHLTFVLGRRRDDEITQLRVAVASFKDEATRLLRDAEILQKKHDDLEKAAAKREEHVALLKADLDRACARTRDLDTSCRKLEGDLAKLRNEIGAARWRELLGGGDAEKPTGGMLPVVRTDRNV